MNITASCQINLLKIIVQIFLNDNNTKPPVNLKDVRVFHCNALQCGKGFISHDKLMDHIATEHPNFVPEVKKETKREKESTTSQSS